MGTHQCTLKELELKKLEAEKLKWLQSPKDRKKKKEKIVNSKDYIFDRTTLKIIKKGTQLDLL